MQRDDLDAVLRAGHTAVSSRVIVVEADEQRPGGEPARSSGNRARRNAEDTVRTPRKPMRVRMGSSR
jgi:hypothetical protein